MNLLINGTTEYAIIFLDKEGYITTWNSGAKKLTGYTDTEIIGKHFSILRETDENNSIEKNFEIQQAEKHKIYKEENWRIKKDGSKFWSNILVTALYDKENKLVGYSKILKDLTEKKEFEDKIRASNQKLSIIMNNSPVAIIATDITGIIKFFNKAAEQMLGYKSNEIINIKNPELFHDKDEVIARAKELTKELGVKVTPGFYCFILPLVNNLTEQREWTYIDKKGRRIPIILNTTSLIDQENNLIGYLGIALDITDKKALENYRNEFISIITHELRTPITVIHGSLSLALSQKISIDQTQEILTIAARNSDRLIKLVNEVLDIQKIEAGKMEFNFKNFAAKNMTTDAIELNKSFANMYDVSLVLAQNNVDAEISGDYDRLIQALTNLISNAVKYSTAGDSVIIKLDLLENDTLRINVSDNGPGIPKEFQNKIFSKFSQDHSSSKKVLGSGLGLSITKSIVEAHNGKIGFISEENKGTTFYMDFSILKELIE